MNDHPANPTGTTVRPSVGRPAAPDPETVLCGIADRIAAGEDVEPLRLSASDPREGQINALAYVVRELLSRGVDVKVEVTRA